MTEPLDPALRQLAQEIDDNTPLPHPWHQVVSRQRVPMAGARRPRQGLVLTIATGCVVIGGIVATGLALGSSNPRHASDVVSTSQTDTEAGVTSTSSSDSTAVSSSTTSLSTEPAPSVGNQDPTRTPPMFTVDGNNGYVIVAADSYCVANGCVDGVFDPTTFQQFGASDGLEVTTPMGWPMTASFRRRGETCAPSQEVVPTQIEPGVFRIDPAGHAGTYDVTLFAQGRSGNQTNGDAIATIVWTTTTDGPLATPTARASVLALHDGSIDSYGVELSIMNIETQPASASATVTVTSAEGRSITLEPPTAGFGEADCPFGAIGTLYFRLDATTGKQAAGLGSAPFTYDVTLTLDGTTYTARAIWPTNEIPDNAPNVELHFDPPLPAPT